MAVVQEGGLHVPRIMTVDEALPYSPFSSVVPFNSGTYGPSLNSLQLNSDLHLQTLYLCQSLDFALQRRYSRLLKNVPKEDEASTHSIAKRSYHLILHRSCKSR